MRSPYNKSPKTSRLMPPPALPNKAKINKISNTFLSLNGQNLKSLPKEYTTVPSAAPAASQNGLFGLDLGNNNLTLDAIKPISVNLTALNLSYNLTLKSCAIPSLDKLRSLSLDNCYITSFEGLPYFPNLRRFSIKNNAITSLKGFQVMPKLEHFDISNNVISFSRKHLIAAIGSIRIIRINNEPINEMEIVKAFKLSSLVGYSLRNGRDIKEYETEEEELKVSQEFLSAKLLKFIEENEIEEKHTELTISPYGDSFAIVLPFIAENIKWYVNGEPEKGSEWVEIKFPQGTKDFNVLPISMMLRMHLVKCDFTLLGQRLSMYSSQPIGRNDKDLCLPIAINPIMSGAPLEGSMISLMPFSITSRITWTSDNEIISQDTTFLRLTKDDVGHTISCLLHPYCPHFPNITFSPIIATSEVVAPLLPIVAGIEFPKAIMECKLIKFNKKFYPDHEGLSLIYLEKAKAPSKEWIPIKKFEPNEKLEYTPTTADVNHYLRIQYIPVTYEGIKGETCYFYSLSRVLATVPTFNNPMIGGLPKTLFPLVAIADYSGGIKGKCSYDWYFSRRPIDVSQGPRRLQKVAHGTQFFTPTANMADGYIAVLMVPVREDNVVGDPVFFALDNPIVLDDAPKPLDVPKEARVGHKMKFATPVDILLSKPSGFCGFNMLKTGRSYTPSKKHLGRIVRIVTDSSDIIIGEIKPAIPKIINVDIQAPNGWVCGETSNILITHQYLSPDRIEVVWVRVLNGFETPIALNESTYVLGTEDVGSQIQVYVYGFDHNDRKTDPVISPKSPFVKPSEISSPEIVGRLEEDSIIHIECPGDISSIDWYRCCAHKQFIKIGTDLELTLCNADVGKFIKATVVLANGITLSATTRSTVEPCFPAVDLKVPSRIVEGDKIVPEITYHGGVEGQSIKRWYRETMEGWELSYEGQDYQTTAADVDCVLRFVYVPVRADHELGDEQSVECGPVDSLPPSATKVSIKQNGHGHLEVTGKYHGGVEGQSFVIWRYYDEKDQALAIGKTLEHTMVPPDKLIGKKMDAIFVPVREDGLAGAPVPSENTITIQPMPTITSCQIIPKNKKNIVDNLFFCRVTAPSNIKKITYQWQRGDGAAWVPIPGATTNEYISVSEDMGFFLLCQVIGTNGRGWKSAPVDAMTSEPIGDKSEQITLEYTHPLGKVYTGVLISTNLKDSQLDQANLVYQKEVSGKWVDVVADDQYFVTCNDIGFRLRAITASGKATDPSNVVELEPTLCSYIRAVVRAKVLKFKAKGKLGGISWSISIDSKGAIMESKGCRKISKWDLINVEGVNNTPDEMILWMDATSKFILIPSLSNDQRLEKIVGKENIRDFIVMVIIGLKESTKV